MMKNVRFPTIFHSFAVIAFVLISGGTTSAANLTCSVRIYPQNSDYVEVFISAKNAEKKTYYIDVSLDVSFFSKDKLLKTENYKFTGNGIEALEPNRIYRRFYKCPVSAVTDVKGGELHYSQVYGGLKPNPRDEILLPRDKHAETSGVSPQTVYEPNDAVIVVKYLPLPLGLSNEIVAGFDRANAYMDESKYKAAIEEYQRIISAYANIAVVYLYLGQAFAYEGDCKSAVPAYLKAVELGRDDILLVRETQKRLSIHCPSPNQH